MNTVYCNHDYEPYAIARDQKISELLNSKSISFKTFKDQVIFEKNEITKDDGLPYKVYTRLNETNEWDSIVDMKLSKLTRVDRVFMSEEEAKQFIEKHVAKQVASENIKYEDIPEFDILCGGFPCQPFSKSGNLKGFEDTRGTLFFDILEILNEHKPKYILLENVSNLVSHDNGNTYKRITESLKEIGYVIPEQPCIISPHNIGIPVLRPRVYIPGVFRSDSKINISIKPIDKNKLDALDYFNLEEGLFENSKNSKYVIYGDSLVLFKTIFNTSYSLINLLLK